MGYLRQWARQAPRLVCRFSHRSKNTYVLFRWTFIIAAIGCAVAILITYFFVPNMTGVDLADEDARFMEYLERNGWEGVVGEDDVTRPNSAETFADR